MKKTSTWMMKRFSNTKRRRTYWNRFADKTDEAKIKIPVEHQNAKQYQKKIIEYIFITNVSYVIV